MALQFPQSPIFGDLFLADNAVTYVWTGVAWNSAIPIHNGTAEYTYDGGPSNTPYSLLDNTLEGGVEHIIGAN